MKHTAEEIVKSAIAQAEPYKNTLNVLNKIFKEDENKKNITVMAIGKAAVPMAKAAEDTLKKRIKKGLLVTKYGHSENYSSQIFDILEASHPLSDENSVKAAKKGLEIANSLTKEDILLVLLSGGGSAIFEQSLISLEEQREITQKLLSRAADIEEINAIRKRLSTVKGGKLAAAAYPATVITVTLSDVLSNDKSVIASAPTVKDDTDNTFITDCVEKYLPDISEKTKQLICNNEEIRINDGGYYFVGDINMLCDAAEKAGEKLGFTVHTGKRDITCEARDAAQIILDSIKTQNGKHLYVFGGETLVTLKGDGKGGRNQEAALSAAVKLHGNKHKIAFVSVGSDGTDGPTDAAGGYADNNSYVKMIKAGVNPQKELDCNNSYYALSSADLLIKTGPTGTNVNDLILVLTDN